MSKPWFYGYPEAGPIQVLCDPAHYDATYDDAQKEWWVKLPPGVGLGATLVDDHWVNPPPAPVPEPPPAPTTYYLAKVTVGRRVRAAAPMAFVALDAFLVNVRNRPADWSQPTAAEPWKSLQPLIPAGIDYEGAEQINVLDPAFTAVLQTLQDQQKVFGTAAQAKAAIATITTPAPLPGEPNA